MMTFIERGLLSARVRQQGELAGILHGGGDVALMLDAVAGHAPRPDLAAIRDELAQHDHVLVVDPVHLVLAELAVLALPALLPGLLVLVAPRLPGRLRPSPTR